MVEVDEIMFVMDFESVFVIKEIKVTMRFIEGNPQFHLILSPFSCEYSFETDKSSLST